MDRLVRCITRKDWEFGDLKIPARTKGRIVHKSRTETVNAPGVQLNMWIDLDHHDVPENEIEHRDEFGNTYEGKAAVTGVVVRTNMCAVYVEVEDLPHAHVYEWQLKKVFLNGIPEYVKEKPEYSSKYSLCRALTYLQDEFNDWVQSNCHFKKLTSRDLDNDPCYMGDYSVGDRVLSDKGREQFEKKKLEYQARLETIGYTHDFDGGLIWS